ncbi:hypothetical protein [Rubrobacter aplysinae]|uniref:hypothetical protein n=1 Tax=Rubrobacter aplysinae TaxID=909625 RepID=UPI00064C2975|nr:hypothetical protein [Rubrobacter aplysinae]
MRGRKESTQRLAISGMLERLLDKAGSAGETDTASGTEEPSDRIASFRMSAQRPLQKTHDYDYEYAGFHLGAEASCRVRIYQDSDSADQGGQRPVIVLSQKLPPGGTSITNLIEAVTAEVVLAELPEKLPRSWRENRKALRESPFHVVEHYSEGNSFGGSNPGDKEDESTSIVTFSDYRIQGPLGVPEIEHGDVDGEEVTIVHGNHTERPRFGQPDWHHEGREAIERLLGGQL